ncbi:MAG: aminotransferase, partial [Gammaproteobacteria bacterium]
PLAAHRRSGIVLFRKTDSDTVDLYRYLQQHNVVCAMRGHGIRFSPHFHTTIESIDRAVALVEQFH